MPFLKPLGVGDLIVLKKKLLRYEAGEIAHIENVMGYEERGRFHRRLDRLETTTEFEREREEESKRDLETTERFELEQEIKNEIRTREKFAAGVEVSGGFGPVQVSAYAKYDIESAREQSEKTAQKYAKEVTERAMERIREVTREKRRVVELQETEEKNEHKFKNEDSDHLSGIYRWVDKKYLVKPLNYGKRLFYEVVIPEPATRYVFSKVWHIQENELPSKPLEPSTLRLISLFPLRFETVRLKPSDINEANYMSLVSTYGAEGVKPPPKERVIVSHSFSKEMNGEGDFVLDDQDVRLPEGYEASTATYNLLLKSWQSHTREPTRVLLHPYSGTVPYAKIHIGHEAIVTWQGVFDFEFSGTEPRPLILNRETSILPISGAGNFIGAMAMNLEIECERSDHVYEEWQLSVYNAIWSAYKKQLAEYEEKIAAARISGGVQISGDNPQRNLLTIKDELKKAFIDMWMREDFSVAPGWRSGHSDTTPPTFPEILPENAAANQELLYFINESFDWDNISYEFLPYYTGRESHWLDLANYSDPDPIFENFLRAGAAVVRIPVEPQFTHAVLYYQLTDRIWSRFAGDIPALSTLAGPEAHLYNSFLNEIDPNEIETNIFDTEDISEDDEDVFEIKVPTRLVWLQSSSELNPTEEG